MSGSPDEPREGMSAETGAPQAAAPDTGQSSAGGATEASPAAPSSADRPDAASSAPSSADRPDAASSAPSSAGRPQGASSAPSSAGRPQGASSGPSRGPSREPYRGRPSGRGRERDGGRRDRRFRRPKRKVCAFCVDKVTHIGYKDHARLRDFVSDRGKILKSRMTGTCNRHQRKMARAVKRARHIALLPYVSE
jgi:small subunit ribosomal protein S18